MGSILPLDLVIGPSGSEIMPRLSEFGALVVWETVSHMVISWVYKSSYSRYCNCHVFVAGPTNMVVFVRVNDPAEISTKTGAVVGKPLRGHSRSLWSVAYSPNSQHIVSGSFDNTIHVWDSFPRSWSETRRMAYYMGYLQIIGQTFIHLLS